MEKGSVKLGGNALAVIAILEYQEVTGDRRWRGQALALGRSLLKAQSPNGAFPVHKVDFASGDGLDFTSGYYPGEAILALTYLSRQDPKGPWLAAARRAATYLIEVRDKKVPDDKLPHDHWLLIALSELQKVDSLRGFGRRSRVVAPGTTDSGGPSSDGRSPVSSAGATAARKLRLFS